ncbi:hypothetical protein LXA43DRAFT_1064058 [Ganoderma leucocontextum]|nr:hypothetical protein LXA43DRAFT_1064058 [Ganoderma leucocontextum]
MKHLQPFGTLLAAVLTQHSAHQATNAFTSSYLVPLHPTVSAHLSPSKVIQRKTFKEYKCTYRHDVTAAMVWNASTRVQFIIQLAMKTCVPMKHPADHERDTRSKAKKRKVAAPDPPAPVPAPRIVQSGKVQEILHVMEKLTKHTVKIKATVSSLDDVNADVKDLLENVKQLNNEIEIIKTELGVVSNDVANMSDDLKSTKQELAKVKELVEHVDAQLEQERELRHMHQREEQACSKLITDWLQTLIAAFCPPDAKTE